MEAAFSSETSVQTYNTITVSKPSSLQSVMHLQSKPEHLRYATCTTLHSIYQAHLFLTQYQIPQVR